MERFCVIALTHKNLSLENVGKFHLEGDIREGFLSEMKAEFGVEELMYLSTCNRVEFVLFAEEGLFTPSFAQRWIEFFWHKKGNQTAFPEYIVPEVFQGQKAIRHMLEVVSSLKSLVVGEREIISQVRKAYEEARDNQISGDFIRLLMRRTIECGKRIYTETNIAHNPVSVVSLAFHELHQHGLDYPKLRVAVVGTGQTNTNFCRFLWKKGVRDFHFYNRTFENAQKRVHLFSGTAYPLSALDSNAKPFDLIVSCTGSEDPIINDSNVDQLMHNQTRGVDLAIPTDFSAQVGQMMGDRLIHVETLKKKASKNLAKRKLEVQKCEHILEEEEFLFGEMLKERRLEKSLSEFPSLVKEIRSKALSQVFSKELGELNSEGQELVERIADYFEEKYMGLPYKKAKEALLNRSFKE